MSFRLPTSHTVCSLGEGGGTPCLPSMHPRFSQDYVGGPWVPLLKIPMSPGPTPTTSPCFLHAAALGGIRSGPQEQPGLLGALWGPRAVGQLGGPSRAYSTRNFAVVRAKLRLIAPGGQGPQRLPWPPGAGQDVSVAARHLNRPHGRRRGRGRKGSGRLGGPRGWPPGSRSRGDTHQRVLSWKCSSTA